MSHHCRPLTWLIVLLCASQGYAQKPMFTHDDTLRGMKTPERVWWDLTYYDLHVSVDPAAKKIAGHNEIFYTVLAENMRMQIDLQPPLKIEKVEQDGQVLDYTRIGNNAYLVILKKPQVKGDRNSVTVWYSGKPKTAIHPPWDGGFCWFKDSKNEPFIATACQGLGASVWWPCKDHMYDEPDSQAITVTVPKELTDVSNGKLRGIVDNGDGTRTFKWFVVNPLNNYGVNANIARYEHWSDTYAGEKGELSLNFYVLPENLTKAKEHFKQAKLMLKAFEHWFGPYPFYEDGYKLVEVPYLGMEHQSCVTYGNGYTNGYLGADLSGTGWGLKWDFIIVHESGHEWFANNITYNDAADMWVHESLTNYSEGLFTEYHYGKAAGAEYIRGCRSKIENLSPIVGIYNVNHSGSIDMYYKGGNLFHTIRQIVDNDELWRETLRGINRDFYHKTVDGSEVERYFAEKTGKKLDKVFDQYLRDIRIPVLEYKRTGKKLEYRWTNCVAGFDMPVKVTLSPGKYSFVYPTEKWQTIDCKVTKKKPFAVDADFYVDAVEVK